MNSFADQKINPEIVQRQIVELRPRWRSFGNAVGIDEEMLDQVITILFPFLLHSLLFFFPSFLLSFLLFPLFCAVLFAILHLSLPCPLLTLSTPRVCVPDQHKLHR